MHITKDGAFYRRYLPHYRSPGCIYHCRFSLNPSDQGFRFTEDWMFAIVERAILADHKKECMIHAYVVMANHAHAFENTIEYVHLNPVRWKLVESPEQYRWSSLRTIYSGEEKYAGWFDLPYVGE